MSEVWKPSVTVAAVMERAGRFCLVEEEVDGRLVYNQPAGHWEAGETLLVMTCVEDFRAGRRYSLALLRS